MFAQDMPMVDSLSASAHNVDIIASPDPVYAHLRDLTRFWIQRVAVPLIMVIGLFGNLITIIIMTRRRMRSTTNMYLAALAFVDMFYLLLIFVLGLSHYPNMAEPRYYFYWKLKPFLMMLTDACSNTSVWLTVTFTLERFIAVRYPIKGKVWCTEARAKKLIALVFLYSIAFALPVPFEWEVIEKETVAREDTQKIVQSQDPAEATTVKQDRSVVLALDNTEFGRDEVYKTIYYRLTAVLFYFLPLLLLILFNSFLIHSVHQSEKQRSRMTGQRSIPSDRKDSQLKPTPLCNAFHHEFAIAEEVSQRTAREEIFPKIKTLNRSECRTICYNDEDKLGGGKSSSEIRAGRSLTADSVSFMKVAVSLKPRTNSDAALKDAFSSHSCILPESEQKKKDNDKKDYDSPVVSGDKCSHIKQIQKNSTAHISLTLRDRVSPTTCRTAQSEAEAACKTNEAEPIDKRNDSVGDKNISGTTNSCGQSLGAKITPSATKMQPQTRAPCNGMQRKGMKNWRSFQRFNSSSTIPVTTTDACPTSNNIAGSSMAGSSQERRITIMLIAVVLLFLVCQVPSAAMLLYTSVHETEPNTNEHALLLVLGNIFNFLMAVNAAGNFILYSFLSKKYRRTFVILFCNCFKDKPVKQKRLHDQRQSVSPHESSRVKQANFQSRKSITVCSSSSTDKSAIIASDIPRRSMTNHNVRFAQHFEPYEKDPTTLEESVSQKSEGHDTLV